MGKLSFTSHKLLTGLILFGIAITFLFITLYFTETATLQQTITQTKVKINQKDQNIQDLNDELNALKSQDQLVRNNDLETEITNIQKTYKSAATSYEKLTDYRLLNSKNTQLDSLYASAINMLSERNYTSAEATLNQLNLQLDNENKKIQEIKIAANVPTTDTPPANGYQRQQVNIDSGTFTVDIISADLNSTRVIVDTASENDCSNNCPVLSLSDYVNRNGAFAGINGSYFCPADYPTCAGKTNSFDTLLMNKNKKYFNSDNNVYSVVPAVIFSGNWARFISKSLEWGRDTGVDSVIANQPLLVQGNQIAFSDGSDAKWNSKGFRNFIGNKGNVVYIGIVRNATMTEGAKVLQTLGLENAMNLDSGGSSALWSGGYKVGPGRNIPNAILFVKK